MSARALPTTREQWHVTARAAQALLLIDDARLYGFITGGPKIDRARCEEILVLAAAQGIEIEIDEATETGIGMIAAFNDEAAERVDA